MGFCFPLQAYFTTPPSVLCCHLFLSHIVPKVLIFPPLSPQKDKSDEFASLACVFLGPTLIHLTDGWQNYTSRTIRPDELYVSLLAKFQHFIKTSKRGMHNEMRCFSSLEEEGCIRLFQLTFSHIVARCSGILSFQHSYRGSPSRHQKWLTFPGITKKTVLHGILKSSSWWIQYVSLDPSPEHCVM